MEKLIGFVKKHWDMALYIIFGAATTAVNYGTYFALYNVAEIANIPSTAVAWAISVAFAYITNKLWVFESRSFAKEILKREIPAFLAARILSGLMDTGIMALTVDMLKRNGNVWKLISNVFVVIFNYVASKLVIFRKK